MSHVGTVFRIERFAIHDGPGIRTTVFLKGCPLRCVWCHSPESQSPHPEFMPLAERCIACGTCVAGCPEHAIAGPLAAPTLTEKTDAGWAQAKAGGLPLADRCPVLTQAGPTSCSTACVDACPTGARVIAGQEMSAASVIETVERDRLFYDESGGGVTFSGGEPLMQGAFVQALVDACRARGIHAAIDTCGFADPEVLDRVRPDMFLFDLKAVDEARHREITGVSNRVILENLARVAARKPAGRPRGRSSTGSERGDRVEPPASERQSPGRAEVRRSDLRASGHSDLVIRFPLVPGLTDPDGNVRDVGRLVSSLRIDRIDVLPYHRAGIAKYARLGRPYPLASTEPPSAERVARVVEMLSGYGLTVRVGG